MRADQLKKCCYLNFWKQLRIYRLPSGLQGLPSPFRAEHCSDSNASCPSQKGQPLLSLCFIILSLSPCPFKFAKIFSYILAYLFVGINVWHKLLIKRHWTKTSQEKFFQNEQPAVQQDIYHFFSFILKYLIKKQKKQKPTT